MKLNVGGIDRILRIVAGLVLIALTLMGTIGGLGLDRRGAAGHGCFPLRPLYTAPGFNTCPMPRT